MVLCRKNLFLIQLDGSCLGVKNHVCMRQSVRKVQVFLLPRLPNENWTQIPEVPRVYTELDHPLFPSPKLKAEAFLLKADILLYICQRLNMSFVVRCGINN